MTLQPRNLSMGMESTSSGLNDLGNLAKLDLIDGNSLYAKLGVGADGSKSLVRELAGFKTTGWNYSQNAIIGTVEHSVENRFAWQRFLPAGPIALLPIGDNFSNIVWTMNPNDATGHKLKAEDEFLKDVNYAVDYGFVPHPKSSTSGGGSIFSWFKTDTNLSANDCFKVPPKVLKLASDVLLLKKYEAERKSANVTLMAILDGFQKAYSVDFGPLNVLQVAVFNGAQYIPPLKRSIISYASGIKDCQFSL